MIPWASFTGRDASYTDLQFPLRESILMSHAGPPLNLEQEFEDNPMLANASERRFALSQFDHSHYDIETEHIEAIESALTQLSTFFDRKGLFMPSPHVPSSPCKDDLLGLTGIVTDTFAIPEFLLDAPTSPSAESALPTKGFSFSDRPEAPRPNSLSTSTRLSISSLIHHHDPTTAPTATFAQATTPITVDSAPSPSGLDDSHLDPDRPHTLTLNPNYEHRDMNTLFKTSDDQLTSTLTHRVSSRSIYSSAIPLSHQTRTRKPYRMRRSSRSRSNLRDNQSETIRKAMIAEEESRRRDMEKIGETWRAMKQKEEGETTQLKRGEDARMLLDMKHERCNEQEGEDDDEERGGRKKSKFEHQRQQEQLGHVTSFSPRLQDVRDWEGTEANYGWERYGKYDRGLS